MRTHSLVKINRFTVVALLVALIGSALQVTPAYAASIVVNSNEDSDTVNVNDGKCTLREAIIAANSNLPRGGCIAGSVAADNISFASNYTITVGSQLPFITTAMTITGKGAANTIIQAADAPNVATWRVFQVTGPTQAEPHAPLGDLTLDGVTVRHGHCEGSCTSAGGIDPNSGGGIYNGGSLTVKNSSISDNVAVGGGGIWNGGTLNVNTSTISGNTTSFSDGAGILNPRGTATVTNSTFAGNIAFEDGAGAIVNGGTLTVTNSTISGNTGFGAGGIFNYGIAILKNTIVAKNTGGNCAGAIGDAGNNLQFGGGVADSCGWGHSSSGSLSDADPLLGMLANNGGPTQTMKLLAGSPAIDAGNPATCTTTDQRGVLRPLGGGCDIGAFETSNGRGPDTVGVFRPSNGLLYLKNVNVTGFADFALNYGLGGDYPVVGDWDGNGTVTIGIYRNGAFYLRNSNTIGFAEVVFAFGQPGDQPLAGDWNGDGVDTIGLFRPSNGQFFLRNSNAEGPAGISFFLGNVGDVGIAGDWDGDGDDTTGVFRPSNGLIYLKNSNDTGFADIALNYGMPGDKPVMGDWNYDGRDTIGIYRNGTFYLRNSNTIGFAEMVFDLGIPGDMPIAGNWDGLP